ncbi:MAG TPA: response regulator [Verrucomicrobiae bacterium]|nr:response regulator [Verrucomicrobiae bacterium]
MKPNHIFKSGGATGKTQKNPSRPPCRILLVDDNQEIRGLNAEVLVRAGYHVDTAESAILAWKTLQASRYDLLITDNTMPGMTGLDLIKKVRSEDMVMSVILASGTVPAEELNRCPWLHVNALLPKPYTIASLLRTVNWVLARSEGER